MGKTQGIFVDSIGLFAHHIEVDMAKEEDCNLLHSVHSLFR